MDHLTISNNTLTLKDNTYNCEVEVATQHQEALQYLANKTVHAEDVVIYPYPSSAPEVEGEYLSGVHRDDSILSVQHKQGNTYSINTGNLVGFIGYGDLKIIIQSRFASERGDFWLHYLMHKVSRFNLVNLPIAPSPVESILNLLPLLFPNYLVRALNQGIFKQYQRFDYNDTKPKGTIEVARHLKRNIPFQGKIAYHTRELSCDNPVTELIRHTIEFLRTKPQWASLLEFDADVIEAVQQIELATPNFRRGSLHAVVAANHRPCAHPLLTDYLPLQQLCLKILRNEDEGLRFSTDNEQVYGVLFDISYLWEEYLALLLHPAGFAHQSNTQRQMWRLAKKGSASRLLFCPDFVFKPHFSTRYSLEPPTTNLVADAKYKRYECKAPDDADVLQMIRYMYALQAQHSLLLSPASKADPLKSHYEFYGHGGTLDVRFLDVPQHADSYHDFCTQMRDAEESLGTTISDFLRDIDLQ
ncbi:MAG: McrC family protein [Candidatus Anaerobiospirillum pullicola]|uniref:McrC family protein n=1 Tax=Candidatus Anaerobiospirillum pullicola TaxID=2838451 RepID=A0A948THM2_9GAMM|nr:McrC family protein [Candidatus Anaerobiospirillum pullicola]